LTLRSHFDCRAATARPPKLLVALEKVASYRPRFRFRETVREAVDANIDRRWVEAVRRALETRRQ